MKIEPKVFCPKSPAAWRRWLEKNHLSKQAVWLVMYSKKSKRKSVTWREAVDVALCFGWIDSKRVKIDEETSHQFFSKRKPRSTWSAINKHKVQQLVSEGLMTEAGYQSIELAKKNGSWTILDEAEALTIPKDLQAAFARNRKAKTFYTGLSKSTRKSILQWLVLARRPETRQKRVSEVVALAEQGLKPKHLR